MVHESLSRSVSFHFKGELYSGMSVSLESLLIPWQGCLLSILGGKSLEENVGLDTEARERKGA